MSDIALSVRGLSKSYSISHARGPRYQTFRDVLSQRMRHPFRREKKETFWALNDVSFDVRRGEVLGIIGRNGAGKSTLLKILSRITSPTKGEVKLFGRVGSLLEVGTGFHPELTGRENIFLNGVILGMTRTEIRKQFDAIVDFAEIEQFLDTPVKHYSSGMYVRLAFAVAAYLEPEILVVDEVLAVGDAEFQSKCLGKMSEVASGGRTVILVTHNMAAVEGLCTSSILLRHGMMSCAGDTADVITVYLNESKSSCIDFPNSPLKGVHVQQVSHSIVIAATFSSEQSTPLPSFGFVISDSMGVPICGANPLRYGIARVDPPLREGSVKVVLRQPRLLDGTYRLSVWFGDGKHDVFHASDCITFEVAGMADACAPPGSGIGRVFPECSWQFTPSSESSLSRTESGE